MRELNLIPYQIKQKRLLKKTLFKTGIIGIIIIILFAAAATIPYVRLRSLYTQELTLESEIQNAKPVIVQNTKLKNEIRSYKEYIDLVDKIQKSNVPLYPILKNLDEYIPKDVVISNLSYNAGTISIKAMAKYYNSINEFEANLQESQEFTNSNVTNITRDEKTGENAFTLIITNVKVHKDW